MKCVIPLFALFLSNSLVEAVPPPQLARGPAPVPVPNIIIGKQINGRFLVPANGMPGAVNIPSRNPRRAIKEEHLLTRRGETFHGTFLGFDPDKGFKWSHPDFSPKEFHFLPDRVSRLNFKVAPLPVRANHHACQVELANGDRIAGDLLRMEDGKLVLKTWYAGELAIKVAHVKSIKPGFSANKVFFEGPKDTKRWTFTNTQNGRLPLRKIPQLPPAAQQQLKKHPEQAANGPTWKLANGTFESTTSNSMVGRQMKEMPERASLEFDLDWTGSMNLYVNFLTDSLDSYSMCNGYCLRLNQSYVYLWRYQFNNGGVRGGRVGNNVQLTNFRGNAHMAIKVDAKRKAIALFINDKLVQKWENLGEFPGDGKGMLFTSRTTNRMTLSRIRVTDWNGNLPDPKAKKPAAEKEDHVLFNNGDHITGAMADITDGNLRFTSGFGEMNTRLEKVSVIHRASKHVQAIPALSGMARAVFKGEGRLSMKITGWKDGKITATSPLFGEASFDVDGFQSIEFDSPAATKVTRSPTPQTEIKILGGGNVVPQQRAVPVPHRFRIPLQLQLNRPPGDPEIKPRR